MSLKVCFVLLTIILYANAKSKLQSCDGGRGVCVSFNLCKADSSHEKETNSEMLDFEAESECKEFFEICCKPDKVMPSKSAIKKS
ncbi:hypothetical protein ACKWTF_013319 [Chironomus riparius]